MVPKWVRGRESLELVEPVRQPLPMLGLGNSVGTPAAGVEGDVIVVKNFDELDGAAPPTSRAASCSSTRRSRTTAPRSRTGATGPSRAAALGAVGGAACDRSGPTGLRTPHTGATVYADGVPKIPAAAIQRRGRRPVAAPARPAASASACKLSMEAHFEPDAQSYNVVGELRGRELPDEIVVVGGHFDSWDVGTGASDDAGGCIVTWEALRLMKKLGPAARGEPCASCCSRTRRTACAAATATATRTQAELENHVLLLESDGGVFDPAGFGFTGPDGARATVTAIASLLTAARRRPRSLAVGGGADIGPPAAAGKIPTMSHDVKRRLLPDPPHAGGHHRAHHAEADVGQRRGDRGDGVRGRGLAVETRDGEVTRPRDRYATGTVHRYQGNASRHRSFSAAFGRAHECPLQRRRVSAGQRRGRKAALKEEWRGAPICTCVPCTMYCVPICRCERLLLPPHGVDEKVAEFRVVAEGVMRRGLHGLHGSRRCWRPAAGGRRARRCPGGSRCGTRR